MKKQSLREWIRRNYQAGALVTILAVEALLLALYFGINYRHMRSNERSLTDEIRQNIGKITTQEAANIFLELREIVRLAQILQRETLRFLENPDAFHLPSSEPVFRTAPNGAYYKSNDNGGASLLYSVQTPIGPLQRKRALSSEALDPLYQGVHESNPNIVAVYYQGHDNMVRYVPFVPDFYSVIPVDFDISKDLNSYYEADSAHNPGREIVWTDVYMDLAGHGWMTSCLAPVYSGTSMEGVVGIDVTVDRIARNILDIDLPWGAKAFLMNNKGSIIAMPTQVQQYLGISEPPLPSNDHTPGNMDVKWDFNLFKEATPELVSMFRKLLQPGASFGQIEVGNRTLIVSRARIGESKWSMFTVIERGRAFSPLHSLHQNARMLGYAAVACMVLLNWLFLVYLRRKSLRVSERIARPITNVAEATKDLDATPQLAESGIAEIDALITNFDRMRLKLNASMEELTKTVEQLNGEIVERERAQELAREQQESLIQADKMASVGILVSGVAHEINNPNNYILLSSTNLADVWKDLVSYLDKRNNAGDEISAVGMPYDDLRGEIGKMIDSISEGSERIDKIVQNLKDFARRDPGTMDRRVDVNALVDASVTILSNPIRKSTDAFSMELGDSIPAVKGNAQQIEQVIINLLSNSCQALASRSEAIVVSTEFDPKARCVIVKVRDEGRGIAQEDMKHIMDPFFTTKRDSGGTGLGLSISYKIIRDHGGELILKSTAGKGTTAVFSLPVAAS